MGLVHLLRYWPLCLVGLIVSPLSRADEQTDGSTLLDEESTETVVVTAERTNQRQNDTAASLSVVEGKTIQERAPADVTTLLREVPGIDVQSMGPAGYSANVSIRGATDFKPGGFGNRVLVLLDGWPINSPDTDGVDWSSVPTIDLDRIEVLRGPASALYGTTALGGVLHLLTRPPATGIEAVIGQGFAGFDPNRTKISGVLGNKGERFSLKASGFLQRYLGIKPPGFGSFRMNSDSDSYGLRLFGSVKPVDHHQFEGIVNWTGSAGGNPGFEGTSEASRSRRFTRSNLLSGLRYRFDRKSGVWAEASLFWSRFRGVVEDPDGGNPNQYLSDRFGLRGVSGILLWSRTVNTFGIELQIDNVSGGVFQLGVSDQGKRSYQAFASGVFVQSQIDIGSGFEATAGLRLDTSWLSTQQHFLSLSPKARIAFRPDDRTVLWIAANRGFRVPTIGELYLKYNTTFGLMFQGNPNLIPESMWAIELGARRQFFDNRLRLELEVFCNLGQDTIEFVYSTPVTDINLKQSRILGTDISAAVDLFKWLELRGSFSWLDARDLQDHSKMLYRPDLKGSVALVLNRWNWELGTHLQMVGSRAYDDFLDVQHSTTDPMTGRLRFPRRSLDPCVTLDLDLSWNAPMVTVALHATNLLNAKAYVIQGYPPPGREWFFEVRLPWQ